MDTSRILSILIAILFAVMITPSSAQQPHIHGQTTVDWYDPLCCSNRDCHPIEDSDLEFDTLNGLPIARYKPTGNIFYQNQWKQSQDERYHVCISNADERSLCLYIRAGV